MARPTAGWPAAGALRSMAVQGLGWVVVAPVAVAPSVALVVALAAAWVVVGVGSAPVDGACEVAPSLSKVVASAEQASSSRPWGENKN